MSEEQPQEKPSIVTDEDWKTRVKQEDAEAEARLKGEQAAEQSESGEAAAGGGPKIDASQLPPASFSLIVSIFSTQAMSAMGLLPNPMTGKAEPEPALAKHYIDLLGVLEDKSKGNLDEAEAKQVEQTLHELRMVFMQTMQGK
ncbi:MAG: DUF1844 domain-containing protein [Rubinisphaera brasiliensis]|uniref:DUF1844 domain-containing protein n=1 Tax=Rubinisphaera brasiliensis (strain ATCC 49424 / DSM 5305 / JCM 21570 / IAM 15109 / NBRC 103401 / IFAM 1448) TaxID=756272 RepID=F0SFY3_RUBBR|nr:DUF1844 domain-containing protein [Rubinisphaera brasiliensis]ADY58272.1 Domain of unknown function DUF1844 [Rubinisphaera brasiliensis DSM 5305]MBR9800954.1 DUF1844 domain-containing protein [bacterium]